MQTIIQCKLANFLKNNLITINTGVHKISTNSRPVQHLLYFPWYIFGNIINVENNLTQKSTLHEKHVDGHDV